MSRAAGWPPSALHLSVLNILSDKDKLTEEPLLLGHWFCSPGNTQTEAGCLGKGSAHLSRCC